MPEPDVQTQSGPAETVKEISAEQLLKNFSNLIRNPADRNSFVRAVTGKTSSYVARHRGPYYKPKYALQFKQVIDEMVLNGKSRIWRYKDYPDFSPRTLYLKLVQSRAYLVDHLDSEGIYRPFCDCLLFDKKKGIGIVMHLQRDLLLDNSDADEFRKPGYLGDQINSWRDKLDLYLSLEECPTAKFEVSGLMLSDLEQNQLDTELSQLENVIYRISQDKVVVVRQS